MKLSVLTAGLLLTGVASVASAHSGFDLMPYYDAANNKIALGGVTHATTTHPITGQAVPSALYRIDEWKVFAFEFDSPFIDGYTTGLGVNHEQGTYINLSTDPESTIVVPSGNQTGFATGDVVLLQATSALLKWDDAVESFVAVTDSTSITLEGGLIVVDKDGPTNGDLWGIGADGLPTQVGTNGFHNHYGSQINPVGPASEGIYAFEVQMSLYSFDPDTWTVASKDVHSDSFWLLYNYNVDDDIFDEAFHFLNGDEHHHEEDPTTSAVPEPASLSLLGLGAAALVMRRRR